MKIVNDKEFFTLLFVKNYRLWYVNFHSIYGNTYAVEHYINRQTSTRNHCFYFRHESMLFAVKDHRFTYQFYSDRTEVRMEIWDSESQRLLSQISVPFAVWQLLNEQRDEFGRKQLANLEITENQLGYFP